VRQTFANWRQLIDMGAFIDDHQTYSWQEALPFMINGEATAYLMGNFAVDQLRNGGLTDDQLDFYQFPRSIEGCRDGRRRAHRHVPRRLRRAERRRGARLPAVCDLARGADARSTGPTGLGQLPVNANASVADDEFIQQGFEMLSNNATGGIAQFFDRDFPAEMASIGMEGLQEFMVFPDNLDDILERLESARQRIYQ
jgi:multiple sugar transport system substrate-binding protein